MKPFNEAARCPKCEYDAIKSDYWDGMYECSPFGLLNFEDAVDEYGKMNETAHLRECIKRTCSRCEFSWEEAVLQEETK